MTETGFWRDPRFIIAYTIILGFAVAYIHEPSDTMNGALIAGFAGAWGYYLGSSNSSNQVREQVGKALDLAAANNSSDTDDAAKGAQQTAEAAQKKADEIKDGAPDAAALAQKLTDEANDRGGT